jgi:ABC-type molybdate transport system substrate-binding protein
VQLDAAGSLRGALSDIAKSFEIASESRVQAKFN